MSVGYTAGGTASSPPMRSCWTGMQSAQGALRSLLCRRPIWTPCMLRLEQFQVCLRILCSHPTPAQILSIARHVAALMSCLQLMYQVCNEDQLFAADHAWHRLHMLSYAGLNVVLETFVQNLPAFGQVHQTTISLMWICRPPAQALMLTQQQRKGMRRLNSRVMVLKR